MSKRKSTTPKDVFELIESRMTPESIRRSDAKARRLLLGLRLAEFRKSLAVDQSSVEGFTQPDVSKIERRGDVRLSTLVDYCRGLGADVRVLAVRRARGKTRQREYVLMDAIAPNSAKRNGRRNTGVESKRRARAA
jgi:hypothetical protein